LNDLSANNEWMNPVVTPAPDSSKNGPGWNNAVAFLSLSLALTTILLPWLTLALQAYGLSPAGFSDMLGYDTMLILLALMATATALVAGVVFFICRQRILGIVLLTAGLLGFVSILLSASVYRDLRREKLTALGERSMPLVEAIKLYEADHGTPPPKLESLVPTYIASVPDTGIGIYPKFSYDNKPVPQDRENPWILYVDTGLGFLNWDRFIYLPDEKYPKEGWGGTLEPMGRWAYVHE